MKHLKLAQKIADIVYPIDGKSSERLNKDITRQLSPVLLNELKPLEDELEEFKRKYTACLKHLSPATIKIYNL